MAAAKKKPFPLSLVRDLTRTMKKGLVKSAGRVDFVRLLQHISESEAGRPWLDLFSQMPPAWEKAPEITEHAAELTARQLGDEGHPVDPAVIQRNLESIGVRYDRQIHIYGCAAVCTLMNGFFWQQDPSHCFVSPDRREVAHIELLQQHRDQGLGVVYLINHSSHLDEFLLASVMAQHGLSLPLFAAGDNMMAIASLAKVLWISSYVVRRRGADRAYMASLFNYCRAVAECGEQQGIFLEAWAGGARSRDGSLRYPRRLVTLRGALAGEREVVIQPVACSFSIVPEDLPLAARKGAPGLDSGHGGDEHPGPGPGPSPLLDVAQRAKPLRPGLCDPAPAPPALRATRGPRRRPPGPRSGRVRGPDRHQRHRPLQEGHGQPAHRPGPGAGPGASGAADLMEATRTELEGMAAYHRETFDQEPDLEDFIRDNPPGKGGGRRTAHPQAPRGALAPAARREQAAHGALAQGPGLLRHPRRPPHLLPHRGPERGGGRGRGLGLCPGLAFGLAHAGGQALSQRLADHLRPPAGANRPVGL